MRDILKYYIFKRLHPNSSRPTGISDQEVDINRCLPYFQNINIKDKILYSGYLPILHPANKFKHIHNLALCQN